MTEATNIRALFDDQAFVTHRRSGTSRYFVELIAAMRENPKIGVRPLTPYRHVYNEHLAEYDGNVRAHAWRMGPLWKYRAPALRALNWRARRQTPAPDIVHHTDVSQIGLDASWDAPQVYTFFDGIPEKFELPGYEAYLAAKLQYMRTMDGFICISESARDDLFTFYPWVDKPVAVAPLAHSLHFDESASLSPRTDLPDRYFVFVGARIDHKNVDVLYRAFAQAQAQLPGVHLVLVGGGGLLAAEQTLLEGLGVRDVTIQVSVSDAELPAIYANAIALAHPSRHEGFGLPVVEAFAVGCPAVLSDTSIFREVAGDAALYFDPDDTAALTEHLLRIASDDTERARLGALGRERGTQFSWQETAARTAAFYQTVLETRSTKGWS